MLPDAVAVVAVAAVSAFVDTMLSWPRYSSACPLLIPAHWVIYWLPEYCSTAATLFEGAVGDEGV